MTKEQIKRLGDIENTLWEFMKDSFNGEPCQSGVIFDAWHIIYTKVENERRAIMDAITYAEEKKRIAVAYLTICENQQRNAYAAYVREPCHDTHKAWSEAMRNEHMALNALIDARIYLMAAMHRDGLVPHE